MGGLWLNRRVLLPGLGWPPAPAPAKQLSFTPIRSCSQKWARPLCPIWDQEAQGGLSHPLPLEMRASPRKAGWQSQSSQVWK